MYTGWRANGCYPIVPGAMQDNLGAVRLRVGRNMRELRLGQDLTQEKLAESADLTGKHLGLIERGQANVTIDVLTKIAAKLSVDVADLFGTPPSDTNGQSVHLITRRELRDVERALRVLERVKRRRARRATAKRD